MKIVIAPNAFKSTFTSRAVANAMATGVRAALPSADIALVPVSDGGDGTLETMVEALGGYFRTSAVSGPLGETIEAKWGVMSDGQTALIETAHVIGLALVPEDKRDPRITTSRGIGELILEVLDLGFRDITLTLGGSATNDGGVGMARALGVRFFDSEGNELEDGGIKLLRLDRIDVSGLDPRIRDCTFRALIDAGVPLTGDSGVSLMFSPGKGASLEEAQELDRAMTRFVSVTREQLGVDLIEMQWAGAAGGLASSVTVFLRADMALGVDVILDSLKLAELLTNADLVITGEGAVDEQTVYDKGPIGVARLAVIHSTPVVAICAVVGNNYQVVFDHGIDTVVAIAAQDGWAKPGDIVSEKLISETTRDLISQITTSGELDSPLPRVVMKRSQ
jgi:glycerate kinase